jgi:hypothetical protein
MRPELKVIDGGCRRALQRDLENVMFGLLKKYQPRFSNLLAVHRIDSKEFPSQISLLEAIAAGPFARHPRVQYRALVSVRPLIYMDEYGQRELRCTIGEVSLQNDVLNELFVLIARHNASRIKTTAV